ncbi:MAG: YceI family protein [Acidobacteriota bacterium]
MTRPIRLALAAVATLGLVAVLALPATAGDSEAPGTIEFKANNKIYDAHGKFERWHFTKVDIPNGDLEKGTVEFEIALASVWEKAEALADHLRQSDFFHVEKFATASVSITDAKKVGDNSYEAVATVDFHGHTRDVPVKFDVVGQDPLKIEGTASLSRTAFGIGGEYDPSNERSIVDDVEIMISATVK